MKQVSIFNILLIAFIGLSFHSCKKDEDSPQLKSYKEMLTGTWILTGQIVDPPVTINGVNTSNIYETLDSCVKDDIIVFNSDNTFTAEENEIECFQGSGKIKNAGTWVLGASNTELALVSSNVITFRILKLNSNSLQLTRSGSNGQIIGDFTWIYQKI